MAWEEESIETGADFQEVGGGKNKLKLIIIVLVVGGLAAAGWFFKDKIFGGDDNPEEAVKEGKMSENNGDKKGGASEEDDTESMDDEGDDAAAGFRVNLEKFTINLSGEGQHFLVTSIVLEVSTEALRDEFIDVDDKALTMIKTRDQINSLLRTKTYAQMRDADEVNEAADEIKHKLSRKLRSGKVLSVYFSEFLVD